MPKRPRAHQLEAEARRELKEIFDGGQGWTVEDLHEDYGEDLLVRIFQQNKATPLSFYVQSKATDSIARFQKQPSKFSVRVSKGHMRHWADFWEPVVVTLYDAKTRKTYWECVQIFVEGRDGDKRIKNPGKTLTISIPYANILDKSGIKRILSITKARFQRHHDERVFAEALMNLLKERAGLHVVQYDARSGILILEDKKKRTEHVFFGRACELVSFITDDLKVSYNDLLRDYLKRLSKTFKRDSRTGSVSILDDAGKVIEQYIKLEDWHFKERVKDELEDVEDCLKSMRRFRRLVRASAYSQRGAK
jgi:hypothetical protein